MAQSLERTGEVRMETPRGLLSEERYPAQRFHILSFSVYPLRSSPLARSIKSFKRWELRSCRFQLPSGSFDFPQEGVGCQFLFRLGVEGKVTLWDED